MQGSGKKATGSPVVTAFGWLARFFGNLAGEAMEAEIERGPRKIKLVFRNATISVDGIAEVQIDEVGDGNGGKK